MMTKNLINVNKPTIGVIDTGTSNIKSVYYALIESNAHVVEIKNSSDTKRTIQALVVPGIGSFGFVMQKLKKEQLDKFILDKINQGIPSFFICVGMQILFSKSYEFGSHSGLGYFKGEVKKISSKINEKLSRQVPFIGWNKLLKKKDCKILKNVSDKDFFYFTHSFFVEPKENDIISGKTNYEEFEYCSSISYKNVFATQFHPEKSGHSGLKIYQNFVNLIKSNT